MKRVMEREPERDKNGEAEKKIQVENERQTEYWRGQMEKDSWTSRKKNQTAK